MGEQGLKRSILSGYTLLLLAVLLSNGCTNSVQSPRPSPTSFFNPGGEASLFLRDIEKLFVAIDEDTYSEFRKVIDVKDAYGMAEMFKAGKIFEVKNNTRVLLIERGTTFGVTTRWKARVLEGPAAGQAGWVHHSWISASQVNLNDGEMK